MHYWTVSHQSEYSGLDGPAVVAFWARPSSSTIFPFYDTNKVLIPHEKVKINFCNSSASSMMGYVYEVKDATAGEWKAHSEERARTCSEHATRTEERSEGLAIMILNRILQPTNFSENASNLLS